MFQKDNTTETSEKIGHVNNYTKLTIEPVELRCATELIFPRIWPPVPSSTYCVKQCIVFRAGKIATLRLSWSIHAEVWLFHDAILRFALPRMTKVEVGKGVPLYLYSL